MSVREAAERIINAIQKSEHECGRSYCIVDVGCGGIGLAEQYEVAAAYLAEHPADEDEPITDAWLREIGFEKTRDGGLFLPDVEGVFVRNKSMKCVFDWKLEPPSCKLIGCFETRIQLRKLLEALGIKTKENKGA